MRQLNPGEPVEKQLMDTPIGGKLTQLLFQARAAQQKGDTVALAQAKGAFSLALKQKDLDHSREMLTTETKNKQAASDAMGALTEKNRWEVIEGYIKTGDWRRAHAAIAASKGTGIEALTSDQLTREQLADPDVKPSAKRVLRLGEKGAEVANTEDYLAGDEYDDRSDIHHLGENAPLAWSPEKRRAITKSGTVLTNAWEKEAELEAIVGAVKKLGEEGIVLSNEEVTRFMRTAIAEGTELESLLKDARERTATDATAKQSQDAIKMADELMNNPTSTQEQKDLAWQTKFFMTAGRPDLIDFEKTPLTGDAALYQYLRNDGWEKEEAMSVMKTTTNISETITDDKEAIQAVYDTLHPIFAPKYKKEDPKASKGDIDAKVMAESMRFLTLLEMSKSKQTELELTPFERGLKDFDRENFPVHNKLINNLSRIKSDKPLANAIASYRNSVPTDDIGAPKSWGEMGEKEKQTFAGEYAWDTKSKIPTGTGSDEIKNRFQLSQEVNILFGGALEEAVDYIHDDKGDKAGPWTGIKHKGLVELLHMTKLGPVSISADVQEADILFKTVQAKVIRLLSGAQIPAPEWAKEARLYPSISHSETENRARLKVLLQSVKTFLVNDLSQRVPSEILPYARTFYGLEDGEYPIYKGGALSKFDIHKSELDKAVKSEKTQIGGEDSDAGGTANRNPQYGKGRKKKQPRRVVQKLTESANQKELNKYVSRVTSGESTETVRSELEAKIKGMSASTQASIMAAFDSEISGK